MPECEENLCENCGEVELVSGTFVSDKGDLITSGDFCEICDMFQSTDNFIHDDFEKRYTTWKNCESIRTIAHKEGVAFGLKNPDPTQYAKREELEEMIEKQNPRNIHSQNPSFMRGYAKMKKRALDIIRTHGKEE